MEGVAQRGHQVAKLDDTVPSRRQASEARREADHERDVDHLLVERRGVKHPAMFAESLAVVGCHDDDRPVEAPGAAERVQQPSHLVIPVRQVLLVAQTQVLEVALRHRQRSLVDAQQRIGHAVDRSGVVGVESPAERRRRLVGRMRREEMNVEEEAALLVRFEPRDGVRRRAGALHPVEARIFVKQ